MLNLYVALCKLKCMKLLVSNSNKCKCFPYCKILNNVQQDNHKSCNCVTYCKKTFITIKDSTYYTLKL